MSQRSLPKPHSFSVWFFLQLSLALLTLGISHAADSAPSSQSASGSSIFNPHGVTPAAISGNPGEVNFDVGNGFIQGLTGPSKDIGITFGGLWLGNYSILMGGGLQPGTSSWNSLLIISTHLDAEKLIGWKGADFGIQFLQFDGENSNGQAGSVQGYNGIVGSAPFDRTELYQAWYRQKLFEDHFIFRIGRMVPTYDFNNVSRPVTTQREDLFIPAVSGLIFTPIFVNPSMLGVLPGYYNSADGVTATLLPTRNSYLSYGCFNGNLANGVQTGLTGPQFNGYYFNILEAGASWVIANEYPGEFGIGAWHQTGQLTGPGGVVQNGTEGVYLFGGQRIWKNSTPTAQSLPSTDDGNAKKTIPPVTMGQNQSISMYYQYGANNSETLPINDYFGTGVTGFGLVPNRPSDSIGFGTAWSWLNPKIFNRSSELMFQTYYQAHLYGGAFLQPTLSYIPTPGASASVPAAWAFTLQFTLLF